MALLGNGMAFLFILCLEESQAMVIRVAKKWGGGGIERQKNKYRETSNPKSCECHIFDRKLFKMSAGEKLSLQRQPVQM